MDFSRKPSIKGDLVILRPVTLADVPALHAGMADPEVARLTGSIHFTVERFDQRWSAAELKDVYARWMAADDRIVQAIVEKATDDVVGESVLSGLDIANQSCDFRIWISGARGKGLGTEATKLTVRHAFKDQGLHRVALEVFEFNPRARHVYEHVGFVHEGVKRQAPLFTMSGSDAHIMSILASEWSGQMGLMHGRRLVVLLDVDGRSRAVVL